MILRLRILFLFGYLLGMHTTNGQSALIVFDAPKHDFGKIREADGPVAYDFKFTNKGSVPLIISDVKASCGCTTSGWSKEPVAPGSTGIIKAMFNPVNRPGVFDKTLTVAANTQPAITTLRIHGIVLPKTRQTLGGGDTIGNILLRSKTLDFAAITTKEAVSKEFTIANNGSAAIAFSAATQVPKHLKVSVTPALLAPQESGIIKVTYDAKLKNDFGPVTDGFILPTNDVKMPKKAFKITASISEYFAPLNEEEAANVPKVEFSKLSHDFGNMLSVSVLAAEIEFRNLGKKDLVVRRSKSNCSCLTGYPAKYVLKPGESSKIKISINGKARTGAESHTITVYCNDPASPVNVISVKANVLSK